MDYVTLIKFIVLFSSLKVITEFIATVLCLIGVIYGTVPRRIGLWYLIVGEIVWIIFGLICSHWFLLSQAVILLVLNIVSLKTWKSAGIKF